MKKNCFITIWLLMAIVSCKPERTAPVLEQEFSVEDSSEDEHDAMCTCDECMEDEEEYIDNDTIDF